jgi:hypothetical protein
MAAAARIPMLFVSLLLASSCAHTRVVKTQPGKGGEIMVQEGLIGDARSDAKKKMKSNCGRRKAQILEEGEAVVGKSRRGDTQQTKYGSATSEDEHDKTEWRIKYKCK